MIIDLRKQFKRVSFTIKRKLISFHHNQDGSAAIEFGFVGLPFFLLVYFIIELALIFMAEININHATYESARKVRTHQAGIETVEQFKADVCSNIVFLSNCTTKLQVEVEEYGDFASINYQDPLDGDGNLKNNFAFNKGTVGSVIAIRTFIEWDIFAGIPNIGLSNMSNGNRLITGFAAVRNEG